MRISLFYLSLILMGLFSFGCENTDATESSFTYLPANEIDGYVDTDDEVRAFTKAVLKFGVESMKFVVSASQDSMFAQNMVDRHNEAFCEFSSVVEIDTFSSQPVTEFLDASRMRPAKVKELLDGYSKGDRQRVIRLMFLVGQLGKLEPYAGRDLIKLFVEEVKTKCPDSYLAYKFFPELISKHPDFLELYRQAKKYEEAITKWAFETYDGEKVNMDDLLSQ